MVFTDVINFLNVTIMNKKLLLLFSAILVVVAMSAYETLYPTGAPAGYTGSPGDGNNCTSCHGGTATTSLGWITSTIPGTGYVPGTTYQITATNSLSGSGKYGFEVSPQNSSGTLLGTLTAGTGTQLVGSGKYVTHSNATLVNNSWTFSWTAPTAGTGTVTFYGAFARGKPGPVTLSTLVVNEALSAPAAAGPISGPSTACASSSKNYSVGSIAGATSYVWSVPTGATITSGQGTTAIAVNFGASASSGNVSVFGSNTAGNGAPSNLSVTVNNPPASAGAITGSATPCQSSSQNYTVTNTPGVSYTWTVPAGWVIASGQGTNTISVTTGSANGSVSVVPENTCGTGPASALSATPSPIPAMAATPSGPAQVDLLLTSSSDYTTTGSTGATSYVWEITPPEAGVITGSGLTANVVWDSYAGNASVKVKGMNTCGEGIWSATFSTEVFNSVGVGELADGNQLQVYPSPSNGNITVNLSAYAGEVSLKVVDLSGKIMSQHQAVGGGETHLTLNVRKGIYMLLADDGTIQGRQKISIQ